MKHIEFIYDFGSPYSYLAHKALPDLAARHGVELRYVPVLIGGIFKATNNQSPMQAFAGVKGKLEYQHVEIARFCERFDVPFTWNPHFPVMTMGVMRGAIYARGQPWGQAYTDTVFDAMWRDGLKMDEPDVIRRCLSGAGLPAEEIIAATQDPEIKQGLIETTSWAVDQGAFGAPTVITDGELFFGKDALSDLDWRLGQRG